MEDLIVSKAINIMDDDVDKVNKNMSDKELAPFRYIVKVNNRIDEFQDEYNGTIPAPGTLGYEVNNPDHSRWYSLSEKDGLPYVYGFDTIEEGREKYIELCKTLD